MFSQLNSTKTLNFEDIPWIEANDWKGTEGLVQQHLDRTGLIFLRNVNTESELTRIGSSIGNIYAPRQGTPKGVATIKMDPQKVGKGYTRQDLFLHVDRSSLATPPKYLMTTVKTKAPSGGLSTFMDGRKLMRLIQAEDPELFNMLCDPKMTLFKQEDGSFQPLPVFQFQENSSEFLLARFRLDEGIAFAGPLAERLPTLLGFIASIQHTVSFEPGEGYLLNNNLWLHGRTSFEGEREILRLLMTEKPRRRLVLFDIDGTLLDSQTASKDAFFPCISDVAGKEITAENSIAVSLHGQTDLNLVETIFRLHGFEDEAELQNLTTTFFQKHPIYLDKVIQQSNHGIIECTGVTKLFNHIREFNSNNNEANIVFGLLTGNSKRNALAKLRAIGVNVDLLDLEYSAFGDTFRVRSQMLPAIWKNLSSEFGPNNTLIVGDTPLDIKTAKDNGAQVLSVATGSYSLEELKSLDPDYALQDLSEVEKVMSIFIKF